MGGTSLVSGFLSPFSGACVPLWCVGGCAGRKFFRVFSLPSPSPQSVPHPCTNTMVVQPFYLLFYQRRFFSELCGRILASNSSIFFFVCREVLQNLVVLLRKVYTGTKQG